MLDVRRSLKVFRGPLEPHSMTTARSCPDLNRVANDASTPRGTATISTGDFELTVEFATNVRTQCVRCRLGEDQDASSVRIRAAKAGRRCSFGSSCDRLVGRVDLSPEASTSRFLSKH
jgi:hypothetical protein